MGGLAEAAFRRRQAELFAHRPAEPGIFLGLWRPGALVEAAEDDAVGLLQAGFEQAPDEQARMAAVTGAHHARSEEHTSELQSLMRISYAVFCLTKQIKGHEEKSANTHT